MLAWTVALYFLADITESYSISCSESCQKNEYKTGCYGYGVGKPAFFDNETCPIRNRWAHTRNFVGNCNVCGFLCSIGQYASGCGGDYPGICSSCTSCQAGFYAAGCGGAQAGVCTECAKCKDNKYTIGCGAASPGICQEASTESDSGGSGNTFPYYVLPGPILFFVFCLSLGYFCRTSIQRRRRWAMAIALREEKLHAQGLACVRLVNGTARVVQVRPAHRRLIARRFDPPSLPILSQLF